MIPRRKKIKHSKEGKRERRLGSPTQEEREGHPGHSYVSKKNSSLSLFKDALDRLSS